MAEDTVERENQKTGDLQILKAVKKGGSMRFLG